MYDAEHNKYIGIKKLVCTFVSNITKLDLLIFLLFYKLISNLILKKMSSVVHIPK